MTIGREQHRVAQLVILVVTIPMMQVQLLFDLDHLSAARAEPVLLSQQSCTKRRRDAQRQFAVAVLKVPLPDRVEGVGFGFDLEIALRFDRLLHPDHLLAGEPIGEAPSLSRLVGKVALGVPASGLVRVGALGPALQPSPDKAVEPSKALTPDPMAMVIGPAAQDRVEGSDERFRGGTPGLLTKGPNLVLESLEASLAGGNAQLGWLAVVPLVVAQGLS
jgi:hypothetical protein